MDFVKDFTIDKEEQSQVKITGEVPFAVLAEHRSAAIKALGKNVKIDGFREGKVPENLLVERIGEMAILTEMAERALAAAYPEALKEHNIDAIGHPQIQITKIAPDNPLGFTATVAVVPAITLPDYKALAKTTNESKDSAEVTDEDVEKQIEEILKQKVAYERLQANAAKQAEKTEEATGATDLPTPESEAAKAEEEAFDPENIEVPELTDEVVKTLGQPGQFETVDDFKSKIREHLTIQKTQEVEAAHRAKITDAIIAGSEMELPQILIDSEIGQMFAQMEEDLKRANLNMDDYLGHIKKTREELATEWKPAAEKRAQLQLILNEIAKVEQVEPDKEALDAQVKQMLEQYKDADEMRVRIYVASVMTNEAVMKMLEEQK